MLSLVKYMSYSKAQRVDESLFLIIVGRDGCNADAEHLWQQRRHIYVVYVPLHDGVLTLPCRPCSGPRQLKFGDYQLVVTILEDLGMARLHLRHYPIY